MIRLDQNEKPPPTSGGFSFCLMACIWPGWTARGIAAETR
jgi:hypothetical protein